MWGYKISELHCFDVGLENWRLLAISHCSFVLWIDVLIVDVIRELIIVCSFIRCLCVI